MYSVGTTVYIMGYFDLGCVEKSHSPAGMVNRMYENMNKEPINMDKKSSNMDGNMDTIMY